MYEEFSEKGFVKELGITFTQADSQHVEAFMPITEKLYQSYGFVHGGATIALLETVASLGAAISCEPGEEVPLGTEVTVRHHKSGFSGCVRGVATLDHCEPAHGRAGGIKQYWSVCAYDDDDDVMCDGTVVVKVIRKENLPAGDRITMPEQQSASDS